MTQEHDPQEPSKWWAPIVHFLTHAVIGSVIFILVALPAWGLDWLVELLEGHHVQHYTAQVLTLLADAIVTLDALLVLAYFGLAAWKALKEWK